jgi:hypothetical protein
VFDETEDETEDETNGQLATVANASTLSSPQAEL